MFWRKGLLIGGTTLIAAIISGIVLLNNTTKPVTITEESLLQHYEQLLKDAEQQAAQNCDDPKIFSQETKDLENIFDKIRQQKHDLIAEMNTDEYIPDLPPLPWEEAPTDIESSETSDTTEQEEYIPRLGELPFDLDGNSTPVEKEYIPPLPWSEPPADIGPSETESETNTDEYIPPLPWSEPFDLEEGMITTMQKIQNIEVNIKDIFDVLKTKCEEKKPSGNCEKACKNYNAQCLKFVPNLNQKMLDDGFSSCMDLCKKRNKEKVQCMEDAKDCVAMTEICGL